MDKIKPGDKPHETNDVVITCMDFRYHEAIRDLLTKKHGIDINTVDQLSIGGASLGVTDGSLMTSLEIAYQKHKTRTAYIFDHIDCGGFGGLQAFENNESKEAQAHFESLDKATEILNKKLPELVVVTYVMGLSGEPLER